MLRAVNHKINQVLTFFANRFIFLKSHLHRSPDNYSNCRELSGAYYKFANLHKIGRTIEI